MTVPIKELGSKLSYQEVNEIIKLYPYGVSPEDPELAGEYEGQIWLDTRNSPPLLKVYQSAAWQEIGQLSAQALLDLIKTVDGPTSGLDAETLQGAAPSSTNSNGTIVERSANGHIYVSSINTATGSTVAPIHIYGGEDDFIKKVTPDTLISFLASADGSGSGLDADKLDGVHASQVMRNDVNNSVNCDTTFADNNKAIFGTGSGGFRLFHNGVTNFIDVWKGDLYLRGLSHGGNIILQSEDSSGVMQTLLNCDPDTKLTSGRIARNALVDLWQDGNETSTPLIQSGTVQLTDRTVAHMSVNFEQSFAAAPRVVAGMIGISDLIAVEIGSVSSSGFTARHSYPSGLKTCHWIAVGKGT